MLKSNSRKKNIAVIGLGLVGTGIYGQGIPSFIKLLNNLSEHFDVSFYNLIPQNQKTSPHWRFKSYSFSVKLPERIHYIIAILRIISHHLFKKRYSIIYTTK